MTRNIKTLLKAKDSVSWSWYMARFFTSEELTKYKAKHRLESQNHFRTLVPVSLGNNLVSLTWEQSCQFHLGAIVPVLLCNNWGSVAWQQTCQSHLATIVPVSLGSNRASLTFHLGAIMGASLRINCATLPREQLC